MGYFVACKVQILEGTCGAGRFYKGNLLSCYACLLLYVPCDRHLAMAVATEQKAGQPEISLVHDEKIEVVPQLHDDSYNNTIQDYESRSIDLRTILGLLVRIPFVWTTVWLNQF